MNTTNKPAIVMATILLSILFIFFSHWALTGETFYGDMLGIGMMGGGMLGGISWIWIPTLLTIGLGGLFGWAIWEQKNEN